MRFYPAWARLILEFVSDWAKLITAPTIKNTNAEINSKNFSN